MQEERIPEISIDYLDEVLLYVKNKSVFGTGEEMPYKFSEAEEKLFVKAAQKLEKDGFIYSEVTVNGNHTSKRYFITFDGLLAIEECPSLWQNRPYRWAVKKKGLDTTWTIVKTVAVFVNALVVLAFIILTFIYKE